MYLFKLLIDGKTYCLVFIYAVFKLLAFLEQNFFLAS